jgi:alpha-D-xyloside xylohydrolase
MLFNQEVNKLQNDFNRLERLDYIGLKAGVARFETCVGPMEVSAPGNDILRLRFQRTLVQDYGILLNPGLLDKQSAETAISVKNSLYNGSNEMHIKIEQPGNLELVFQQEPLRLAVYRAGKLILASSSDRSIRGDLRLFPLAANAEQWLFSLALKSGESVYGLGEKFGRLDKRGQLVVSWNRDATGVNAEISYKNVPFAWSPGGWGIFIHTTARVTHGVGYSPWSHRSYVVKVDDPTLDIFLIFADSPAEMLRKYTMLTGRTELPPVWSYGAWMSRAFYQTADEIIEVAQKLRAQHIPCDVLTLDGRAWHKSTTRFDFSWDKNRYPDPADFIHKLRTMNYRLCLWEYPYLSTLNPLFAELAAKKFFLQTAEGETFVHRWLPPPYERSIPHLQPSGLLDFTNPEAYIWFRDMHRSLFEMGVSVMKTDYGEAVPEEVVGYNGDTGKRLHNIYALLYNRCTFEASQMYGDKEGLVWGRASWAGGQRYPVQWGGDPQGDWEGLAASIRGGLSWGMSGGAFYAHDIGGFYGPQQNDGLLGSGMPNPELYIRWAQAGIMASHTRFHGTGPREPWHFGEQAQEIVRKWLAWRYQLIPYLQGCALEASQSGMPVMRAMVLSFPEDRIAWQFDQQYMLGGSLLVIPVVVPGGKAGFYLPAGRWFDIWNQTWVQGPGLFEWELPLDYIPVFGREGTILPLGPAVQHTGELKQGIDIEQVWAFGTPKEGMLLPHIDIKIFSDGSIGNLPSDVKVKYI